MADLKEIADSLIKGKAPQVKELVKSSSYRTFCPSYYFEPFAERNEAYLVQRFRRRS